MLARNASRLASGGLLRWTLEAAILLVIAGTIFSTWFAEGLLVPIVVTSGSMAPTLLGPHRIAECPNCGMTFPYDAEIEDGNEEASCPNCGTKTGPSLGPVIAGDRLRIDRATFG